MQKQGIKQYYDGLLGFISFFVAMANEGFLDIFLNCSMELREAFLHPYSSINLKRDIKATLYDSIEIPWG